MTVIYTESIGNDIPSWKTGRDAQAQPRKQERSPGTMMGLQKKEAKIKGEEAKIEK